MNIQKNRFWTFCFSLVPGAGEMYFGLYRMGISLMLCFFGLLLIPMAINLAVFSLLAVILWFYSFLHVHNLRNLPLEEFCQIEDKCIWEDLNLNFKWNSAYKTVVALVLILAGIFLLWDNFSDLLWMVLPGGFISDFIYSLTYRLPRIAIAAVIIFLGVKLIGGKKKELEQEEAEETPVTGYTDIPVIDVSIEDQKEDGHEDA